MTTVDARRHSVMLLPFVGVRTVWETAFRLGSKEGPMQKADVLIIGAGASGGVAASALAEAGFDVLCLEQGAWPDPASYPAPRPTDELEARKQWSGSPNARQNLTDYPLADG